MFNERKYDKKLNIKTRGEIDWPLGVNLEYFRTESTLYRDLNRLVEEYDLLPNAKLVDFGSGKGRIIYYFNHQLKIEATGIELSKRAYNQLLKNFRNYTEKYPILSKKIHFYKMKAEDYQIKKDENIFYFFNPFTIKIFKMIVKNIEKSLKENQRVVDIIIYYPGLSYTHYLDQQSDFHFIQLIKTKKYSINSRECFKVYRYYPQ